MKLFISYNPETFDNNQQAISTATQDFFEELRGVQMAPRMDNDFVWWLFRQYTESITMTVKGQNIVLDAPSTEAVVAFLLTYLSGYDLPTDPALLKLLSPSMRFQDVHKLWHDACPDIGLMLIG